MIGCKLQRRTAMTSHSTPIAHLNEFCLYQSFIVNRSALKKK